MYILTILFFLSGNYGNYSTDTVSLKECDNVAAEMALKIVKDGGRVLGSKCEKED